MLYRFRNIESLLNYKELENEEIFFCPPNKLNDPMEGYKDIIWNGDKIIWQNLFRHYLLCLYNSIVSFPVIPEDKNVRFINIYLCEEKLPSIILKNIFIKVKDLYFNNEIIAKTIDFLSSFTDPIRENELKAILMILHPIALHSITKVLIEKNLLGNDIFNTDVLLKKMNYNKFTDNLVEIKNTPQQKTEDFFKKLINLSHDSLFFFTNELNGDPVKKNYFFLIQEYSYYYVDAIENLIMPQWFTACFMSDYHNSSLWGYYGKNHTGVCLIFEPHQNNSSSFLPIKTYCGFECGNFSTSRKNYSYENINFHKINYSNKIVTIDFFNSLIKIVQKKYFIKKQWFLDEDNNESSFYKNIKKDEWINDYTNTFLDIVTTKDEHWKYENEFRLILEDYWNDYDSQGEPLKYNFNDLKGIIFGIKTTNNDKMEIFNIINKKLTSNKRTDFKFYQAYYDNNSGLIEKYELPLCELYEIFNKSNNN